MTLAGVLAGCATQQARGIEYATPAEVCEAFYFFPVDSHALAESEAKRRGIDCTLWQEQAQDLYSRRMRQGQAAAAQRELSDAERAVILQYLLRSPAPIQLPTPPQTINCQSFRIGSQVNTTCR